MHSSTVLAPLAFSLLPVLALAKPRPGQTGISVITNSLFRRQSTLQPMCNGCGNAIEQSGSQQLIDQIDTTKVYNIPWDSTQNGWTGPTTLSDGEPAMNVIFADSTCNGVLTTGTIDGDLLKSSLQDLVNIETGVQDGFSCFSCNGQYQFDLGEGASCGGSGGP